MAKKRSQKQPDMFPSNPHPLPDGMVEISPDHPKLGSGEMLLDEQKII
jgi:hypothetical protein